MDQIMNKVGSYWLGKKANKEFNSVGDDFNVSFLILFAPFQILNLPFDRSNFSRKLIFLNPC